MKDYYYKMSNWICIDKYEIFFELNQPDFMLITNLYFGLTYIKLLDQALIYSKENILNESEKDSKDLFDIAIYPCKQGQRGICLEFKAANSIEELDSMAERALLQIEEMNYLAEFHARGITDVWCYGIAFYGKYLKLVCKK